MKEIKLWTIRGRTFTFPTILVYAFLLVLIFGCVFEVVRFFG